MCKIMEDMRKETVIDVAKNLLKTGKLSLDDIANATGLTFKEVDELRESITA